MVMPAWYDKLVEAKMHKVTQLSEAETAKEIAEMTEGAFAVAGEPTIVVLDKIENGVGHFHVEPKKKRGRPPGSKNRPKTDAKA